MHPDGNIPHKVSKLKGKIIRRKRLSIEKASDKIDSIKIIKHSREGVLVSVVFHYENVEKPVPKTIWIPFPDPLKVFQRIKQAHPAFTNPQCKTATKRWLSQYVHKQLRQHWRKLKPVEESLELEEELNMKGS